MRKFFAIFLLVVLFSSGYTNSQELISLGSQWKYLKGKSAISSEWLSATFDDSQWTISAAPFRYGDGSGGTVLSDMQNSYVTVFLRKEVEVAIADSVIGDLSAVFSYDDGFRMWINGVEAFNRNAPVTNNYNSLALTSIETIKDTDLVSGSSVGLKNGKNIVCVLVYNVSLTSSDLFFDVTMSLSQKLPKAPDVSFSYPGGYYASKFDLTLKGKVDGDTIKYSLDSSDPVNSATAIQGQSPITITIDPDDVTNRTATPAVVVRASVIKSGYKSGLSETRTYIFLDKVKSQTYPGGSWPLNSINDQVFDYNVDSRIINDSRYTADFKKAFTTIPTVSLVTDNSNLFDPARGIYVNAMEHSEDWECPASIELINTDNTQAFAAGAGLRIRGGYSRHAWNPKHAFRIFFKDEYGKKKLKYPIFGDEGVDEFDKFDLRCAQNYSWSLYNNTQMTYAQDETCRDIQGFMGHPYTRSRYCQLFLNGTYFGLFEFQERAEANFAASYLGGSKSDYDVVKVATDLGMNIEATNGALDKYRQLYDFTTSGFTTNEQYYKVQGLNKDGLIDTTSEKLVDVDNLIDYMINIFYSANFDAPLSQFGENNMPNNFYAIKNRNSTREGFIFLVHDAEHTFNYIPGEGGNNGVNENRVNLISRGMKSPTFEIFTPQWLHYRLSSNPNYLLRFADRATKYLYNNGLLTAPEVEKDFRNRASQIDMAIIGESARWGDSRGGALRTKDNDWIPAVNNTVSKFIKFRTPIVINQLKAAKLLPKLQAPTVKKDGTEILTNDITLLSAFDVTISNINDSGKIYFTVDGSDPRLLNNSVGNTAKASDNGAIVSIPYPLILKTRILNGTEWSALREIVFTNTLNRDKIRITEIQYNPADRGSYGSKSLEFVEFKNISDVGIAIGGCKIDSAVNYTFPKGTVINPKGFVVVAADITAFESNYLQKPTGRFSGNLSNEGERLILTDENDAVLIDLNYDAANPWPIIANGSGFSLVPVDANPEGDPSLSNYWKGSTQKYGSPFADDGNYVQPSLIPETTLYCDVFPNPARDIVRIKAMGNGIQSLTIYDLNGRALYSQQQINSNYLYKELNIGSLKMSQGVYFISIQYSYGNSVKKLIIQSF